MLPLSLLRAAENEQILVEVKNGDTYTGTLVNCDNFMNINMKDITLTSADAESFWKINECYVRGSTIKYLRVDTKVLDSVDEIEQQNRKKTSYGYRGRGGRGRGRGDGDSRGRGRGGRGRGGRGGSSGRGGDKSNNRKTNSRGGRGGGRGVNANKKPAE
mmetsp:Transcript_6225/g.9831  ORF Transcript_6225/g.9831 Transcript_6225/m.9831 type:complete len:159 (+) Transcript_6225:324-800(+)